MHSKIKLYLTTLYKVPELNYTVEYGYTVCQIEENQYKIIQNKHL